MHRSLLALGAIALAAAAACSGDAADAAPPASADAAATTTAPTGNIITVEMITDGTGSYFKPAQVTARQGDVIRYVLTSGVHNASFPADSNAGSSNLPASGPMLQLPGQTYDVPVTFGPGDHYFHCDPHALLGMVGHVKVEG